MSAGIRSKSNSIKLVWQTFVAVLVALKQNKLTALIPVAIVTILAAIGLFFINLVSPIAPFVYSLF